ncbi:hypothetical protein DFH06DRAFT_1136018 [Mycena polygramma]|nr:hypothetical protein DFH06DRAFT_1136018 [Mycena polygramma]
MRRNSLRLRRGGWSAGWAVTSATPAHSSAAPAYPFSTIHRVDSQAAESARSTNFSGHQQTGPELLIELDVDSAFSLSLDGVCGRRVVGAVYAMLLPDWCQLHRMKLIRGSVKVSRVAQEDCFNWLLTLILRAHYYRLSVCLRVISCLFSDWPALHLSEKFSANIFFTPPSLCGGYLRRLRTHANLSSP